MAKTKRKQDGKGYGLLIAGGVIGLFAVLFLAGVGVGIWVINRESRDAKKNQEPERAAMPAPIAQKPPPKLDPLTQYLRDMKVRPDGYHGKADGEPLGKFVVADDWHPGYLLSSFNNQLPANAVARVPAEIKAVALLRNDSKSVGGYTFGQPIINNPDVNYGKFTAYRGYTTIIVFRPATGKIIYRSNEIAGPPPPQTIPGSAKEAPPTQFAEAEVVQYLANLASKVDAANKRQKDGADLVARNNALVKELAYLSQMPKGKFLLSEKYFITFTSPISPVWPDQRVKTFPIELKAGVAYAFTQAGQKPYPLQMRLNNPSGVKVGPFNQDFAMDTLRFRATQTGIHTLVISARLIQEFPVVAGALVVQEME
jgi:hypothetical protein